jgi:hypothetical protein
MSPPDCAPTVFKFSPLKHEKEGAVDWKGFQDAVSWDTSIGWILLLEGTVLRLEIWGDENGSNGLCDSVSDPILPCS